ncbi:MAG: hypothetical protein WA985_13195 [Erythrobacter sp.]
MATTAAVPDRQHGHVAQAAPFRFALLCHQRSGSNALSAMLLREQNLRLYGQLFNPFLEYTWRNWRHGFGRYRAHREPLRHFGSRDLPRYRLERAIAACLPAERDLERHMRQFYAAYDAPGLDAIGFKLHDFQLSDADLTRLARRHVDGTVMLWRRNRLKAAVSWAYAVRTDVWSRKSGQRAAQPPLELDIGEIRWFIEKTKGEVENWRDLLDRSGAHWIELTYEDHVKPRDLRGLYDFLGLPFDGPPEFATRKLADARYTHVTNAAAIERGLGSPEDGYLFED